MNLKELLVNYVPWDVQEQKEKETILAYLKKEHDLYTRENIHHFTASPWIINRTNTKVLMVYHNIYRSWGWCGGHADGDKDLLHVALKEGKEETGLLHLKPYDGSILSIDILPVARHIKNRTMIEAHEHINITFLCIGDEQDTLRICPNENSGVMWVDKEDIDTYVTEEHMKKVYHKLVDKSDIAYK